MDAAITFRQTTLGARDLEWLQARLDSGESLTQVGRAASQRFGWARANGEAPLAAFSVLARRLDKRGLLRVPTAQRLRPGGARHQDADRLALLAALGTVPGMVECQPTGPFTLRPIAPEERDGFRLHLQRYHYLGFQRSVGESLQYAAFLGEELVALMDWGAAVLHCPPRERYIGWDHATRERGLSMVAGNRRFLLLPWVRLKGLASRVLGASLRRLSRDWQAAYGHPLLLAESFVDTGRKGTCYRASNWLYLGQTLGFTRRKTGFVEHGNPKAVFVYPLHRNARRLLREGRS